MIDWVRDSDDHWSVSLDGVGKLVVGHFEGEFVVGIFGKMSKTRYTSLDEARTAAERDALRLLLGAASSLGAKTSYMRRVPGDQTVLNHVRELWHMGEDQPRYFAAEIAEIAGVTPNAVRTMSRRHGFRPRTTGAKKGWRDA